MTPAWWVASSPASAPMTCGEAEHLLRWEAGGLVLSNHPDVEAEQALGALGGDLPQCVRIRRYWDKYADDPVLVTLGRRPRELAVGVPAADAESAVGISRRLAGRHGPLDFARRAELLLLLSLPAPFVDRLVLTAMARAASRWVDPGYREAHGLRLGAALAARAEPGLRRLGAAVPGHTGPVEVHCVPAPAGEPASIRAERTALGVGITASVPLLWLAAVWGMGISEPGSGFVLSVTGEDAAGLEVEVAEWQRADAGTWQVVPRTARLARDADDLWRLSLLRS